MTALLSETPECLTRAPTLRLSSVAKEFPSPQHHPVEDITRMESLWDNSVLLPPARGAGDEELWVPSATDPAAEAALGSWEPRVGGYCLVSLPCLLSFILTARLIRSQNSKGTTLILQEKQIV